MISVGTDIEDISRFKKYSPDFDDGFLNLVFSKKELEYCFSQKSPAKHLAARFCAKEAFIKAISELNICINFNEIEVLNTESGKPYLHLPERFNTFETSISLSHDKTKAIAVVIVVRIM